MDKDALKKVYEAAQEEVYQAVIEGVQDMEPAYLLKLKEILNEKCSADKGCIISNVGEILEKYLKDNGYDGLYNDNCGCRISDLMPCECNNIASCQPGYKVKASDTDENGFDFYILGSKEAIAEHEKNLED